MVNDERVEGSSTLNAGEGRPRLSEETLVERPEAGPLPKKQGEIGYVPPPDPAPDPAPTPNETDLPIRHPADHSPSPSPPNLDPDPDPDSTPTQHSNASTSSFKQFLRTPRPLPTIYGVRSATVLRLVFVTFTLIASIIGWVVTIIRVNAWDKKKSFFEPPPSSTQTTSDPSNQMTSSSIVFVHVAFGAAVLFELLLLERSVYRFRAERYAYLHPEEMAAATELNGDMGLSPWNRPPLPTYAAALGVRGTGDVEDNMIAAPPPPEYGNTRGSTLLLTSDLNNSTEDRRDVLGRPVRDWSRPVSYREDELREHMRRSLDLEAALARLQGPARPENALTR